FHSAAIGGPSINLDAWAETAKQLRLRAANHCATRGAELLIIEGAMGVIDGAGREGHGATADVAAALSAPLVIIVDASRQSHSALLPVLGLQVARPNLKIAGVIFNRVGSERHAAMLRASADEHGIACLGTVRRNSNIVLPERHLGLVQALETTELDAQLDAIADVVSDGVDLAALQAAASDVSVPASGSADALNRLPPLGCKIAIARDAAFSFIYPHHIADWAAQDVSLTYFSPLADEAPSLDADAVFLPGGYPELHAAKIAGATKFHRGMHSAAARGARIYGECGGYMVLGEALIDADGTRHQMTGLLPLETSFAERKRHLGYRQLKPR
ncbi:MAG: cobyrinate a,c-diamide synthase, partial [Pseudomonadota bacterium]